jgi:hypothetical protein
VNTHQINKPRDVSLLASDGKLGADVANAGISCIYNYTNNLPHRVQK